MKRLFTLLIVFILSITVLTAISVPYLAAEPEEDTFFSQGIALNTKGAEINEDSQIVWQFDSEDPDTIDSSITEYKLRSFTLNADGDETVLLYKGKNSNGVESTTGSAVYLVPSETKPETKGKPVTIMIKEAGEEEPEFIDVDLDANDRLRVSVIRVQSGGSAIADIWIPLECLVLYQEPVTVTETPEITVEPTTIPETTSPEDGKEENLIVEDDEDYITIKIAKSDLNAYSASGLAKVVLTLRKGGGTWTETERERQVLSGSLSGLKSGDSNAVVLGCIFLSAAVLISLIINAYIIMKNRR